jgi:hypothetical protein
MATILKARGRRGRSVRVGAPADRGAGGAVTVLVRVLVVASWTTMMMVLLWAGAW